ncbi:MULTISPECIES: c-type cytochrome [unclassified Halomonas]|uniref:c-type cytochrome n=1 Tax=unclassified Halomonas TaxID=2609666 RepID=UPI0028867FFE|nr:MULTISPECIES: c-type cytochrome [unclassified Halomonas]MDT0502006.1 c-type cytochrome [Halomonas sp. PAR7]MDT0511782.1 c-type cytochrome [Halomonas sp. LES1]MDT0592115.1 c-type cytochrome [Halomonas sp. PAR8]
MTDHRNSRMGRSSRRRFAYAGVGAVVLLAAGVLIANYNLLPYVTGPEEQPSQAEENAQIARKARQDLAEQRKAWQEDPRADAPRPPKDAAGYFQPSLDHEIPDNEFGESVRRGREIFLNTGTNARQFAGNELACANCHLDGGRKAHSAPMWAAINNYPAYRGKNKMINTMEDRINGCFTYSMNAQDSPSGGPPPSGHQVYKDLQSYFYWLGDGAPINEDMPGRGYPSLEKTDLGYDRQRGEEVFVNNCAVCHGLDGQGQKDLNGRYIFPPLWGPHAYNWGAGMHRVNTAAGFIKANMPLGKPYSLSDQQAWDVAAYINSFPRPADPRQLEEGISLERAQEKYHQHMGYYNQQAHGVSLGEGATPERWERFVKSRRTAGMSTMNQQLQ